MAEEKAKRETQAATQPRSDEEKLKQEAARKEAEALKRRQEKKQDVRPKRKVAVNLKKYANWLKKMVSVGLLIKRL
jgi:translation initiation factor IF-2